MEELKSFVDAETWEKLEDAKIDDNSLCMLNNQDMIEIGLELGPRKIIQEYIAHLKTLSQPGPSTKKSQPKENHQGTLSSPTATTVLQKKLSGSVDIRATLEKSKPFRGIFYNKLLAGITPKRNEICLMVRLLCHGRFYDDLIDKNKQPGIQEKHQLALDILEAFPHLQSTRPLEFAPPEAAFFWRNGGKGPGHHHTGFIENRMNNMRKEVPKDKRKFRRTVKLAPNVNETDREKSKLCAALAANTDNIKQIGDLMKDSFDYYRMLLFTNSAPTCILDTFPHLCSFSGIMLQQTFERLTKVNPKADIRETLIKCLYLDHQSYQEVEDKIIRGALRAITFLTNRGIKNENGDPNRSAVECYAAPLIKWIKSAED